MLRSYSGRASHSQRPTVPVVQLRHVHLVIIDSTKESIITHQFEIRDALFSLLDLLQPYQGGRIRKPAHQAQLQDEF